MLSAHDKHQASEAGILHVRRDHGGITSRTVSSHAIYLDFFSARLVPIVPGSILVSKMLAPAIFQAT